SCAPIAGSATRWMCPHERASDGEDGGAPGARRSRATWRPEPSRASGATMSLHARVTAATFAALAVVLGAFSVVLYTAFRSALVRELDEKLASEAAALAGMVEDSPPDFEYAPMPEFEAGPRAAYFEIWHHASRVLSRSPSLGSGDLARRSGLAPAPLPHRPP